MKRLCGCLASIGFMFGSYASGATPEQVARGQQLFTQEFASTPLTENGDGLGPLFNHTSCVACHHSGGVGGAGDNRFNARTIGVSELTFDGTRSPRSLEQAVGQMNPGFVTANQTVVNTFALHRRGGSPAFQLLRQNTLSQFNPSWDNDRENNSDSIHSEITSQTIASPDGAVVAKARVFSRNTTALFGAGLIDQIPDSMVMELFRSQQRHPEINGRPSTLADGRIGKFGWRANFPTLLEFTENACVNELGLQSKDVTQPADVMNRQYQNSNVDIDNESIVAMAAFIAALPSPAQEYSSHGSDYDEVSLGAKRFHSVGCAVCHVPDVGPAIGVYSDLLLHDMGPYSMDLNPAPPYRKRVDLEYDVVFASKNTTTTRTYYGGVSQISTKETIGGNNSNLASRRVREFRFETPQRPPKTVREPVKNARDVVQKNIEVQEGQNAKRETETTVVSRPIWSSGTIPTNFNQEWRTAPLWGLRDSAPYMHDGRAETVLEAISMHGGESEKTRNRFFALPYEDQMAVLAFLETFVAPTKGVTPVPKDFTRHILSMK